jgi:hypothetical protein
MKTMTRAELMKRAIPFRLVGTPSGKAHDWHSGQLVTLRPGQDYVCYGLETGIMRHSELPADIEIIALVE